MTIHISDELLSAYVDGELEQAERAKIEQAITHDARLAQRVAQRRALRGRLRNVFDGTLRKPLPRRLVNAARPDAADGPAKIIDLARVRAERARRTERQRVAIPRRAVVAIAASLLLGLGLGVLIEHVAAGTDPTEYRDGALFASGSLNHALSAQLSNAGAAATAIRVGFSFRARSGVYCRTFVLDHSPALAGLACRERQGWRVLTLLGADAPVAANAQPSRLPGPAMPPALLQAVNDRISGEPLDAPAEAKARRNSWH